MNLGRIRWLLAGTQFLLLVDTSIINVVVPSVAQELGFDSTGQSWIANAYLIAFGGVLLLSGRVADILGRRRVFRLGLITLALGSALAAVAAGPVSLVAGRALQGVGAALAAAASFALVLTVFDGEARQRALGLLAAMAGAGGAAGTVLGGLLTQSWGWRSTFWVSVIAALVLLALAHRVLAGIPDRRVHSPIDLPGALLLMGGQVLLAFGLLSLSSTVKLANLAALALAVGLLIAFAIWQQRGPAPLIPPDVWRNAGLMKANLLAGLGQIVLFPMFFIVNLYLQQVLGFGPFESGLALLPLCSVVIATASQVPRLIAWLGLRCAMTSGFIIVGIGLGWLSALGSQGSFIGDVLGPTLIVGVGLPIVSITTGILAGTHSVQGREGLTSGLLNTAQQFGAVIGIAAFVGLASYHSTSLSILDTDARTALTGGYSLALMVASIISMLAAVVAIIRRWDGIPETA
ncbi:MFS transporter [Crenobacter sp. SG2305]|uniref:MFS transporter n=1 Tax=Crenobacter oryzisoli TaxID=3056844 RepID=UPI0025AB4C85|nr:MFS transporter [Crenobacter sp. SG2305]MDN0083594.1 MFS transporter [Crenobacter sp. SG2305]